MLLFEHFIDVANTRFCADFHLSDINRLDGKPRTDGQDETISPRGELRHLKNWYAIR